MNTRQKGRLKQVSSTEQLMLPVYALVLYLSYFGVGFCYATDNIASAQVLKDPETLVSNSSIYRLGFFSPPNSTNRYIGIWYNQPSIIEVVWVANRNNPLTDSSGVLKITVDGNLQVSNANNEKLWSSNGTSPETRFHVARLLDTGNLVVQGFASNMTSGNGTIIWQSFDHPTDTTFLYMKTVLTTSSDLRPVLQSWSSPSDPSDGRFSTGTNSLDMFQIIIYDKDSPYWRSGPWNGNIFIGNRIHNTGYGNVFVSTGTFTQDGTALEVTEVFSGANESLLAHYTLSYQGILAQRWWDDENKKWGVSWHVPENDCDIYGKCGKFGSCNPQSSPICSCLKGFEPVDKEQWKSGNWTSGCVRRKQLQCGNQRSTDGFLRLQTMKVPDNAERTLGLNKAQCANKCLTNCSCLAYAYDTEIMCMTWSGTLIDIQFFSPFGVDLYIRLAESELGRSKRFKAIIAVSVILGIAAVAAIIWFLRKWRFRHLQAKKKAAPEPYLFRDKSPVITDDLQIMKFESLVKATNGFHESNLLGIGGFGQVYKGKLEDGQVIAVKRLSRASGQGLEEFMNEVTVIAKLQHRNLVKLLGCCVQGEEKMLIYEHMPNKSLDAFLFDPQKRDLLHWHTRFNIIEGICRGLLYLHRDSRLKIIHRDLKASNILLDDGLNPKISDFGMARIFGCNEEHGRTQRVVGTYGYMSPEYAMEGHFSEKSDVFSFGVLLLEIVSAERNSRFWYEEESLSLLGYAWKLWNEKNISSLIDPYISNPCFQEDIVRCIHVGLLCVQEFFKDRPNTSTVMSMLVRDIADLPNPKQPGFVQRQMYSGKGSSPISEQTSSRNCVTVTSLSPR